FDCLKYRRQIRRFRRERGFAVANEKVFAAGLLGEIAKALGRRAHCESTVVWREERQVDHVERDALFERDVDDAVGRYRALVVEPVADEHDDASLGANWFEIVESVERMSGGVEQRRPLVRP